MRSTATGSMQIAGYSVGVVTLTGFIIGVRWLVDGLGSPILGAIADRAGRQRSITFLFASNAMAMTVISFLTGPGLLILLIFAFFLCSTALMTLLSDLAGQSGPRSVASYGKANNLDSGNTFLWNQQSPSSIGQFLHKN